MAKAIYTIVERFRLEAECTAPLHAGNASGDKAGVLVHPVKNVPFIQASGLAGVLRAFYQETFGTEETEALFGSRNAENGSRLKITDGFFAVNSLKMERRPHVAINRETGTASESEVRAAGISSGHKFETEYVGAGSQFTFEIYIFSDRIYKEKIAACLEALNAGDIQVGGLKSTGNGYIRIRKARYGSYDMRKEQERKIWLRTRDENTVDGLGKLDLDTRAVSRRAYRITLNGRTEGELLVKDLVPEGYGEGYADAVNIRNANGDYIIPGSSLKGTVRTRMETIAKYKNAEDAIYYAFGKAEESDSSAIIGNLRFQETVVGNVKNNDNASRRARIHIDKFTGGVMNGALFSEKYVFGDLKIRISILKDAHAEKSLALLLFALRDLAVKAYQIGSGYSVGKGYIDVESVLVEAADGRTLLLDFKTNQINDKDGLLENCMQSLEACYER